ncbi:MAG: hypothetical protein Q7R72_02660 [bacterium]|nr:hypothetical protein [bacterium]
MTGKPELKIKAIELRRQGKTYSEIRSEVPVAKSTLSLWFLNVGLADHQKQRITQKRIEGQKRGATARRTQRIKLQQKIWSESEKEIGNLTKRELWLIGVALYWAEGSKEKAWGHSTNAKFSNSDPRMIRVFLLWLKTCMNIKERDIWFEIFIHEHKRSVISNVIKFWSRELGCSTSLFGKIYFKKNKILTKRKNTGFLYNGVLRVNIAKSSTTVRMFEGWTRGIDKYCRIV